MSESTETRTGGGIRWIPLESNPEVLNKYIRQMGASVGEWVDVYTLDDESLAALPAPVKAVVLLFPISESYDKYCKEIDEEIKAKGQQVAKDVFFMKQFVHNACGTVGMIHALANNAEEVKLEEGGILSKFMEKTKDMDPTARGNELEKFDKIAEVHDESAHEGQTAAPNRNEDVITHFVTFIQKSGHLYELDGRREAPINHGDSSADTFLKDAAKVCKARMERDPSEYRFTVVALTLGTIEA